MNKKIIIVGAFVIIAISISIEFILISRENKIIPAREIDQQSLAEQVSSITINKEDDTQKEEEYIDSSICDDSMAEFGNASNSNTESILYKTVCIIKDSDMAYGKSAISRTYIRGDNNSYNKKIFETKEKVMTVSVAGDDNDKIRIKTSDERGNNEKLYFFDKNGKEIEFDEKAQQRHQKKVYSRDKKYIASLPETKEGDYRPEAIVIITNVSSGKTNEYDFRENVNSMNGIVIDSWSPDGRYVYVKGGIYEFAAPAKLWRIDVKKNKIKSYNLDGFSFPVRIYPENNLALVTKGSPSGDSMFGGNFVSSGQISGVSDQNKILQNIELHKINLETGKISLVIKEKALGSFRSLLFDGENIYYESTYELVDMERNSFRNSSVIKKINLEKNKSILYSDDESHIKLFIPERSAFLLENNKQLFYTYLKKDERDLIGNVYTIVAKANQTGIEYTTDIIGLVN
jgi:hypothetical protein